MRMDSAQTAAPRIGTMPCGPRNSITDLAGVKVGHCTLAQGTIQTGVTVIQVHGRSHFLHKVPAATTVFNGFGKSVGLVQVQELGVLETPIALTNTFSVPAVAAAQIAEACQAHPEIGRSLPTVNPLVFECNDGYLNDIRAMAVEPAHYRDALRDASESVAQGAVGAGRGMSCFGLKGGIGTASRVAGAAAGYTVGALVLSNYGRLRNLIIDGEPVGRSLDRSPGQAGDPDKGSIIMLLGTDAPLDALQLRRLCARAALGLARTGSYMGHGSGDIALAFSTAYTVPQLVTDPMPALAMVHQGAIDSLFEAAVDATEQAILNSLWYAQTVVGRDGHVRESLRSVRYG